MDSGSIRIQNLSFSYGERNVFDDFSLDLPDVRITAIAGPSGCGKTTLLRLMAGFEKPAGGTLSVPPPEDIAFLFQEDRLLPDLTAAAQVAVVLPRAQRDCAKAFLDAAGLSGEYDTPVAGLSGGMRRRVALARTLAYGQDKALILMDEPFTGIDPARAESLMVWIRSLCVPVICSAHDAHTLALADSVIYLA